ncbi:sialate O-acetylesterase [Aestuariivivens sediminicola]|uniref:sialate O-acetylesterase n=1 Tax=Aestuariivivens sediminicola TaxID=2913560 RepID=UPI001F55C257|nr:sialate O-acetylesterase [Aestuariivivens sediminicola]
MKSEKLVNLKIQLLRATVLRRLKQYNILIIISCAVVINSCTSERSNAIDVFLIGGQSNATGQGYMKNIPTTFKIDTTVLFYYSKWLGGHGQPMTWQPLCQASETPDKFGVELSLGSKLQQLYPDRKCAIIKHALSGSNLYEQWHPGENNQDTLHFGEEYEKFIHTVQRGIKELKNEGYQPTIRAMFWQQGEADARDIAGIENATHYGSRLKRFIQRVREQLEVENMLFIYGYVIPEPLPRFTGREEVRHAQKMVDQNSGDVLSVNRAFVVHTDDLPLRRDEPDSPLPNDVVHFNTLGILELGERFALRYHQEIRNDFE